MNNENREEKKEKKQVGLTTKILFGLLFGAITGFVLNYAVPDSYFKNTIVINGILQLIGQGFIRLMQMLVVPLVLCSLVCGSMAIGDTKKLGNVGVKALGFYICTTALAVTVALTTANVINPGIGLDMSKIHKSSTVATESATQSTNIVDTFLNIIPSNIFNSLSEGTMLQVILFALILGVILAKMGDRVETVKNFFSQFNDIMMEMTMIVMKVAPIGVFCLIVTSSWCKERIEWKVQEGKKFNYLDALKNVIKNRALLGLIFSSLAGMIAASVVNGLNTYLFKDYFGDVKVMSISGMLNTVYAIITFIGTKYVSKKLGKKEWCMYGAGFAALVFGILFFVPVKNPLVFIAINGICYLGASGFQVLIWAMVNDAIDYQELMTGERNEGMVYSTYSFFRKLSSAVSASLSSFTLAMIGYNVNEVVQTAAVKANIWKSYTAIYAVGYLIAVLILFFVYPLSKKKTEQMLEELAKRRAKGKGGR